MPMSPGSDELRAWQASRCAAEPHYEFGGPIGALGIMVGLPLVTLMLYVGCGRDFCVTDLDSAAELPGLDECEQVALVARLLEAQVLEPAADSEDPSLVGGTP